MSRDQPASSGIRINQHEHWPHAIGKGYPPHGNDTKHKHEGKGIKGKRHTDPGHYPVKRQQKHRYPTDDPRTREHQQQRVRHRSPERAEQDDQPQEAPARHHDPLIQRCLAGELHDTCKGWELCKNKRTHCRDCGGPLADPPRSYLWAVAQSARAMAHQRKTPTTSTPTTATQPADLVQMLSPDALAKMAILCPQWQASLDEALTPALPVPPPAPKTRSHPPRQNNNAIPEGPSASSTHAHKSDAALGPDAWPDHAASVLQFGITQVAPHVWKHTSQASVINCGHNPNWKCEKCNMHEPEEYREGLLCRVCHDAEPIAAPRTTVEPHQGPQHSNVRQCQPTAVWVPKLPNVAERRAAHPIAGAAPQKSTMSAPPRPRVQISTSTISMPGVRLYAITGPTGRIYDNIRGLEVPEPYWYEVDDSYKQHIRGLGLTMPQIAEIDDVIQAAEAQGVNVSHHDIIMEIQKINIQKTILPECVPEPPDVGERVATYPTAALPADHQRVSKAGAFTLQQRKLQGWSNRTRTMRTGRSDRIWQRDHTDWQCDRDPNSRDWQRDHTVPPQTADNLLEQPTTPPWCDTAQVIQDEQGMHARRNPHHPTTPPPPHLLVQPTASQQLQDWWDQSQDIQDLQHSRQGHLSQPLGTATTSTGVLPLSPLVGYNEIGYWGNTQPQHIADLPPQGRMPVNDLGIPECRLWHAGHCTFGDRCRFAHYGAPETYGSSHAAHYGLIMSDADRNEVTQCAAQLDARGFNQAAAQLQDEGFHVPPTKRKGPSQSKRLQKEAETSQLIAHLQAGSPTHLDPNGKQPNNAAASSPTAGSSSTHAYTTKQAFSGGNWWGVPPEAHIAEQNRASAERSALLHQQMLQSDEDMQTVADAERTATFQQFP